MIAILNRVSGWSRFASLSLPSMLHTSSAIHPSSGYDPQDGRHRMRHLDRLRVTWATFWGKIFTVLGSQIGVRYLLDTRLVNEILYEGERVRTRFARLAA